MASINTLMSPAAAGCKDRINRELEVPAARQDEQIYVLAKGDITTTLVNAADQVEILMANIYITQ